MLRSARPFLKEVRGSRSRFAAPRVPVAVDDVFGSDERPPRDIHEDVKPLARRLDPAEAPQPFVDLDFRRQEPTPTSSNELRQRAESLFKTSPAEAPQPEVPAQQPTPNPPQAHVAAPQPGPSSAEPPRRVLPDLTQEPDELTVRLEEASARRRGRKPGSKNKTSIQAAPKRPRGRPRKNQQPTLFEASAPAAAPAQKIAAPHAAPAAAVHAPHAPVTISDTLPIAPLAAVLVARSVDRSTMRLRLGNETTTFRPHERWKARLPIFRKLAKYL